MKRADSLGVSQTQGDGTTIRYSLSHDLIVGNLLFPFAGKTGFPLYYTKCMRFGRGVGRSRRLRCNCHWSYVTDRIIREGTRVRKLLKECDKSLPQSSPDVKQKEKGVGSSNKLSRRKQIGWHINFRSFRPSIHSCRPALYSYHATYSIAMSVGLRRNKSNSNLSGCLYYKTCFFFISKCLEMLTSGDDVARWGAINVTFSWTEATAAVRPSRERENDG